MGMQNMTAWEQVYTTDSNAAHKYTHRQHDIVQIMILWQDEAAPVAVRLESSIAHVQAQTVDWSAQQVLGSLRSYPDREERLASPEVPNPGGLRIHSTLLTAILRRMWQVLKCVLMRSTCTRPTRPEGQQSDKRGGSHTKARHITARDFTPGHVRGPLVDCAVLFICIRKETWPMESSVLVISRVVAQWYICTDGLPTTTYSFVCHAWGRL